MDELDNILNDSPSENPVETEDVEQTKEKEDSEEKESDSNKLEVEDQENENSSDRQVDDDAQVPQEDEEQETDKKDEDDQEAQNAKDDEEKDEASEGETKKERRKRRKEKKSKRDKKDKKDKKKKKRSKDDDDDNLKSKIFGDSDDDEDASKDKDADFDTADVDIEEEGKRALEEIVEKKKEKKKKRSRDEKKKSRSSKRKKGTEEEDPDAVPEQTLPPSNEPNDFDLVIESLKKGHRRRKSDGPPEGSDEFVRGFVAQMDLAADEDVRANQQHLPALNKVKLLPEVSEQLAKKFLHEIFVSSGVLNALKKWLDPLPDGSLPNIKVREVVLRGLLDMGNHVQTEDLRESGIGRAIMVLSKHPQETLANKKSAKTLIELWSRPIFNLSSKYKDMHRAEDRFPVADDTPSSGTTPAKTVKAVSADLEHTTSASTSSKSTKDNPSLHARIPEKIALDFKVMPKANEEAARLLGMPKRGGDSKGLGRKSPGNKKVDRAVTMSIEGRGVYH